MRKGDSVSAALILAVGLTWAAAGALTMSACIRRGLHDPLIEAYAMCYWPLALLVLAALKLRKATS